jgi:hypothetical protein
MTKLVGMMIAFVGHHVRMVVPKKETVDTIVAHVAWLVNKMFKVERSFTARI